MSLSSFSAVLELYHLGDRHQRPVCLRRNDGKATFQFDDVISGSRGSHWQRPRICAYTEWYQIEKWTFRRMKLVACKLHFNFVVKVLVGTTSASSQNVSEIAQVIRNLEINGQLILQESSPIEKKTSHGPAKSPALTRERSSKVPFISIYIHLYPFISIYIHLFYGATRCCILYSLLFDIFFFIFGLTA